MNYIFLDPSFTSPVTSSATPRRPPLQRPVRASTPAESETDDEDQAVSHSAPGN